MGEAADSAGERGSTTREWALSLSERCPELTASMLAVGLVLSHYADFRDGSNARPSQATLAAKAGCDKRTVRRALAAMEGAGLIVCTGRFGYNNRGRIWSLLTGSDRPVADEPNRTRVSAMVGGNDDATGQQIGHGSPVSGEAMRTPQTGNEDTGVQQTGHGCPQTSIDQTKTTTTSRAGRDQAADGTRDGGGGMDFLERLNSSLPPRLHLTPTDPVLASIDSALVAGWDPDELRTRATANLDGIKSPGAIVQRLALLARTSPPAPSSAAGRQWREDPQLLRRVASRLLAEAQHLGRVLDRLADDDFDVALVELAGGSAVSIAVTHPTVPNPGAWSVGWTVQSDGRTTCMAAMDVGAEEVAILTQHGFELEADGSGVSSASSVAAFDALTRATFHVAARHYGEQLAVVV